MEKGKEIIQPRAEKMNNNQNDKEIKCVTIPAAAVPSFGGFQIGDICFTPNGFAFGRTYNSPATMPKEANTYLYVEGGQVRLATYENGQRRNDIGIMESIADIQVLNEKVVMVTFFDGKTEKAVIDTYDTFNIEQGIAICIMKKSFSKISNDNGSSVYNKLVEYGLKAYNDILAAESKAETEKYEKEARAKRKAEKAQRKRARKAAEKREAEIEIQKEAYLRAMRELHTVAAK